jgi:hypothetical protein
MKILVFLHGTAIMHQAANSVAREERVRQVRERDPSVQDFGSYVPTPGAVEKIAEWHRRGATVEYFSSHRNEDDVQTDQEVLRRHAFPNGPVHSRAPGESYGVAAERLNPDVIVEDDCESMGGAPETIAARLRPAASRSVACLVLPEFVGLEGLPDDPSQLLELRNRLPP